MEWETAAGDAVLRVAGGIVVDLDGHPLVYNKRGQYQMSISANGHLVAYSDAVFLTSEKSGAEARWSPRLLHEHAADGSTPRSVDGGS
jgi:hypothetical protein